MVQQCVSKAANNPRFSSVKSGTESRTENSLTLRSVAVTRTTLYVHLYVKNILEHKVSSDIFCDVFESNSLKRRPHEGSPFSATSGCTKATCSQPRAQVESDQAQLWDRHLNQAARKGFDRLFGIRIKWYKIELVNNEDMISRIHKASRGNSGKKRRTRDPS